MREDSRVRGIALIELLVVLMVLVVLVAIMSQLHSRPAPSYVLGCGTNLAGIGKAMLIYSNDYQDELPRAGGASSQWTGRIADWEAKNRTAAYGLDANGTGGQVSMGASFYLLVKYMEVTPKSFVCRGDKRATEFRVQDHRSRGSNATLVDLWDFGLDPAKHCSYTYQMLYGGPPLKVSADAGLAIAADRNPWMDEGRARSFSQFRPATEPFKGTPKQDRLGNAIAHEGNGQNVMFLDTHVEFKKWSHCSVDDDNIYTSWEGPDKVRGKPPQLGSRPADVKDSLLVNDPPAPRE